MSSNTATTDTSAAERGVADHTLRRRWWRWRANITPWSELATHKYKGSGTGDDPFVVTWLEEDAENPYNWNEGYKWFITLIVAFGMLSVTMGSSILSGSIQHVKAEFPGHHPMSYIMVTGIYILGFVVGPFLWAPWSEVFGRRSAFVVTQIPFTAFDAAVCGAGNLYALLLLRFCAGIFGCCAMTNAGGIISDMFRAHKRGLAMGVFGAMPWMGPVIGPIVGGFLGDPAGWRWVAAVAALFTGYLTFMHLAFLPETYAPVLMRERAKRLSAADPQGRIYRSEQDVAKPLNTRQLVINQLKVPYILMFTEPIVFILSMYMATIFGLLYMQFTSFPIVFQQLRGWGPGIGALAFLGICVGCNLALVYIVVWGNPSYARALKERGALPPEARLPSAMVGAIILPAGLFWFAWTCMPLSIHWIVPIIGTVPYGAGLVILFMAVQNYLVDAYLPLAASVLAGGTVMRSLLGVIIPLFTIDMYNALGPRWASSIPAFLALAFTPFPFILLRNGQRVRRWTKYGREADDIVQRLAAAKMAAREAELAERAEHPVATSVHEGAGPGLDHLNRGGARNALDDAELEKEIEEEIQEAHEELERIRSRAASARSMRSEGGKSAVSADTEVLSMHTAIEGRRTPFEAALREK
ncbi:MFS general substrate transporter [Cutaneotrichosporon oleaginosum]|uniref:MFS general substrate transporter n=1 Tax=Cutaneotrichosporon oleaginosum TaxID=879819 RepID=A0A0J0XZ79_9TREE|nr:MFS general substrate transporter [Cutaneotrichosporon oleaginosum]KLT46346.1 MFS general substrate transporter [Cutaneotrichosporon oleaginosum]TXT15282.1 hypothetical protein COLE_01475 [Cutaneotrichosporon oleaginosum]